MILTIGALVKDDQGRQYILDELLGSGGFGSVFKAHRDDGTIYAVKTLLPLPTGQWSAVSSTV